MPQLTQPFSSTQFRLSLLFTALLAAYGANTRAQTSDATPPPAQLTVTPQSRIVVTGTRTERDYSSVPAQITSITDEDIERKRIDDIRELVREEPAITVSRQPARFTAAGSGTGRDSNSSFNIRGIDGNRVLIQIDGIRVPNAFSFGATNIGRGDYIDTAGLSRVEILRGPASALYGSDGLAGAVSFFTANPQDLLRRTGGEGYGSIATSYNQEDRSKSGTLAAAGRTGPVEIMAIVTERRASELDNFGTVGGEGVTRTQANPQQVQSSSLLAKWVYRFDANNRVTVTLDGLDSNTDTEALTARGPIAFTPRRAVDVDATDSVERKRASVQHSARQLSWGFASSLDWAIYGQDAKARQLTNELRDNGQLRVRDQRYAERVLGLNTQLTKRFGDTVTHRLTYGVDAAWSTFVGNTDGTLPPFGERFPLKRFPDTDYNLVGAFIQDEIGFADDRVLIIPAIRYDRYSLKPEVNSAFVGVAAASKDSAVSPKLGLVYQLSEFALYANLAKGYKAPTPNQVNNGFTNQLSFYKTIANPDLKPETNTAIELGARKSKGGFTFDAAVFSGKYKDFIEQVQVSGNFTAANPAVFQFVNLSEVSLRGLEFKAGYSFESGLRVSAGYAQAKGEEQDTRQLSTNPAENTAQRFPLNSVQPAKLVAAVGWRSKGGDIGIDASAIHLFAKKADDAVPLTAPQVQFLPPAATTLDLNAFWRVSKNLSLSAGVRNVTDKKYWQWADVAGRSATSTDLDAFTQPGRAFSAAIRLEL